MSSIARLTGAVKHYDWGGSKVIPSLLQLDNTADRPFAEYWLGVHPLGECLVEIDGRQQILADLIKKQPEKTLGKKVFSRFGNLPYLLKLLDVKDMLSIQVHPSKLQAERGFQRENAAGIPLDSFKRNYKDDNHKPELLASLGDFWLLHGFKNPKQLIEDLDNTPELKNLAAIFENESYRGLYFELMKMPQGEVNRILAPMLDRIIPLYHGNNINRESPDFWAARAALSYSRDHNIDRGIFSIYLFNILKLKEGEALYQREGVPHAYLEGQNVEIMANSDNVLRAGLTSKHIDVDELLSCVKYEPAVFNILDGMPGENMSGKYVTAAPDFELSRFLLTPGAKTSFTSSTAEILLLTKGSVILKSGNTELELKQGYPSAFVFPMQEVSIEAKEASVLFRASVPGN